MSNIESVVDIGEVDTYDLEVDHEDHQFFLSNGILTSNSHAMSYAYDSVMCTYLFYHHPDEWICSWLESLQGNSDKLSDAINEVKTYGYSVLRPDVNESTRTWKALPGKKLLPSLTSISGIGVSAYEEIERNRPYRDLCEILWNDDGSWKHSKANKGVWDSLTKIGALDSVGLVGDDKLFKNYRQLNYVVVERADDLKKKNSLEKLSEIVEVALKLPDWSNEQRAEFLQDISGDSGVDVLMDEETRERLAGHGVPMISDVVEKGIGWFVLLDFSLKKTKNGKEYLLLVVTDSKGKTHRVFCWGGRQCSYISKNSVYLAEIEKSNFGYSTQMRKLQRISHS